MKKKKVNLGSGTDYLAGWINVDVEPFYHPDVIADLQKPFPFVDGTIDELKASDILEHFTKEDGVVFLRECHRVLRAGGTIFLRSHDVFQIIRKFSHDPQVMVHFLYGNTEVTGIFGAHKFAYTKDYLFFILHKIGFSIESYEIEDTNFVVVAKKNKMSKFERLHAAIIGDRGLQSLFPPSNGSTHVFTDEQSLFSIMQTCRGLFALRDIDVVVVAGHLEKIVISIIASLFALPVVWIEREPSPTFILHNRLISKILYRLTRSIPQLVIVRDKAAATAFMMHTRVSLAKIVLLVPGENVKTKKHSEEKRRTLEVEKILGYLQDAKLLAQVSSKI